MEPYYTQAEHLYQVHGARGEDPTEPPASAPYPFPSVSHEPRIQQLANDLAAEGRRPFHAPCGVILDEAISRPGRDRRRRLRGARRARASAARDVDVTLVDRMNHHLFQPLLYQVAAGRSRPARRRVGDPRRSCAAATTRAC